MVSGTPAAARDPEACRLALELLLDRARLEVVVCDEHLRVQHASCGAERVLIAGELPRALADGVRAALGTLTKSSFVALEDGRFVHLADVECAGSRIFVWLHDPLMQRAHEGSAADPHLLGIRGRQLVKLLREGLSNREIATRLGLREATVKTYLHELYQVLGVRSRTAALAVIARDSPNFR